MRYLTGTIPEPAYDAVTYEKWVMENAIVRGCLIIAMEPSVMNMFIRLPTAKNIWEAASQIYYEGVDRLIIDDLSRKAIETKQTERPVASYFSDLKAIWQELDYPRPITFTQDDVIKVHQKEIDEECVYLFLISLDDVYDPIRGEILHTETFPNPATAFSTMRSKEQCCNTMLNPSSASSVAMAINKHGNQSYKERRACEGRDDRSSRKEGKCVVYTAEPTPLAVAISLVMSVTSTPYGVDTAFLQQSGNIGLALLATDSQKDHGWILDSRATDHMMFDASLLHHHRSPACSTIANANCVPFPVTRAGSVD
ncbi:unnamed protein product [Prunus armeniaca]